MDLHKLAMIHSIQAEMLATQAVIEGMKAENQACVQSQAPLRYSGSDFDDQSRALFRNSVDLHNIAQS